MVMNCETNCVVNYLHNNTANITLKYYRILHNYFIMSHTILFLYINYIVITNCLYYTKINVIDNFNNNKIITVITYFL